MLLENNREIATVHTFPVSDLSNFFVVICLYLTIAPTHRQFSDSYLC